MKWYKRDPDAFKGGTLGLTLEEVGAYSLLLDDIYARDGNVPDNISYLCRLWRCDPRIARRLRQCLIDNDKMQTTGVLLTNLRAKYELSSPEVTPYLKAKSQQNQQNEPTHLESRIKNKEGGRRANARSSTSKFTTIKGGRSYAEEHSATAAIDRLLARSEEGLDPFTIEADYRRVPEG
jgi:uncharacterized protein YdaU (DUF1376 family)